MQVLNVIPTADDVSRRCLYKLQAICNHHGVLPTSYDVSGNLSKIGDGPVTSGGFSDIWEGIHDGRRVCVDP